MVRLDCATSHHDGVTLVTLQLRDIDGPTRVSVRNCLDGPVWPPRREGLPEAGWTDDGFAGVVEPGTHTLGYATPAPPADPDPPAELTDAVPAPDADDGEEMTDAADVVRTLGDPAPPADAVPVAGGVGGADANDSRGEGVAGDPTTPADGDATADLPSTVGPWLGTMARRVHHAEALADAESVPEATAAVRAAGGLAAVRDIAAADDERHLRLVARRARRLADRRADATVPVETFETLA